MTIELNHTIVPSHDKDRAAQFIAALLGLANEGHFAHFAIVRVNERLTLDFDDGDRFEPHHYAFKISESQFDEIFARAQEQRVTYGSGPGALDNMQVNHRRGGRGFYFRDPIDGHVWEVLTA